MKRTGVWGRVGAEAGSRRTEEHPELRCSASSPPAREQHLLHAPCVIASELTAPQIFFVRKRRGQLMHLAQVRKCSLMAKWAVCGIGLHMLIGHHYRLLRTPNGCVLLSMLVAHSSPPSRSGLKDQHPSSTLSSTSFPLLPTAESTTVSVSLWVDVFSIYHRDSLAEMRAETNVLFLW